ncbi:MAG: hypothetical protein UIC49_02370 [Paludibacteraceae bacterium]|nr:hypothetical protein [Paludibacteraceae bacterium]
MSIYALSDTALIERIGAKVKARRIANQQTQRQLAVDAGVSLSALCSLESGKNTSLLTLIAVLRTLRSLDMIDSFLQEEEMSPLLYAQMQKENKQPQRVRKPKQSNSKQSEW